MNETWKDIMGFEGKYRISDLGRIKSIGRMIGRGRGYFQPEMILKTYADDDLYINITLSMPNRRKKRFRVSILVAKHFLDGEIKIGDHICHKDNDRANNVVGNLYIGNLESNTIDKYKHGSTKLSIENTKEIRLMAGKFTQREIAEKFGVKRPCINRIINMKRGVFIK